MRLFSDQRRLLLDAYQGNDSKITPARAIEAVAEAYRWIGGVRQWSYLHRRTQIVTSAPYTTGTVAISASTRIATVSGGTWPTWAANGLLIISSTVYAVQKYLSSTQLLLQPGRSPAADVAAGTAYTLCQIEYVLPQDYVRTEELVPIGHWWWIRERQPGSMLETARLFANPARPWEYMVRGSYQYPGYMAIEFMPPPNDQYTIDLSYFAKPRPRSLSYEYTKGTVSVTGTAVVGTNTAFTQAMVGCRLRQGTTSNQPVGEYGPQGSLAENTVLSVEDATHLTLIDNGGTSTNVMFVIDDPVDIERTAMDEVFCRQCENQYEKLSHMDKRGDKEAEVRLAFAKAVAADIRLSPRQQDPNLYVPGLEALVYGNLR